MPTYTLSPKISLIRSPENLNKKHMWYPLSIILKETYTYIYIEREREKEGGDTSRQTWIEDKNNTTAKILQSKVIIFFNSLWLFFLPCDIDWLFFLFLPNAIHKSGCWKFLSLTSKGMLHKVGPYMIFYLFIPQINALGKSFTKIFILFPTNFLLLPSSSLFGQELFSVPSSI